MMNIKLDVIMDKLKYQTISKIDNLTVHSGNRFLITRIIVNTVTFIKTCK